MRITTITARAHPTLLNHFGIGSSFQQWLCTLPPLISPDTIYDCILLNEGRYTNHSWSNRMSIGKCDCTTVDGRCRYREIRRINLSLYLSNVCSHTFNSHVVMLISIVCKENWRLRGMRRPPTLLRASRVISC